MSDDAFRLPSNRTLAEHRLKLLGKKFLKNPYLHLKCSSFTDCFLENGHARRVPKNRLEHPFGVVWYLPHHPVMNSNKSDKIRDCAAQYNGVSLKYWILQVPGLTNNLVGVLTRFRQEPIAVMIDVHGMFYQVRVNLKDCDALRFPWWPANDLNVDQAEYQLLINLFRAASSPSHENSGLGRTADAN